LLESKSARWLVSGLAVALFVIANLPWHLDDYDQAKQAFTSFEMIEQGHWFYQHTPNGWVATKPPLVGWISAAIFDVTRSWDIAWRLPSMAGAVALFVLVGRFAGRVYGPIAGLLAASALALNLFAPRLSTLVRTDMPLTLVIFLIGAQIWAKVLSGSAWNARDRVVAFILLSAAMLVKGPIVYAFLLPGIVAFQFWMRRSHQQPNAWSGWWPWVASLLVFVAWVAIGVWFVPEFFEHVIIREFGGRFEGTHRAQPLWFYLPHLVHKFAPWSILMALVVIFAKRFSLQEKSGSARISAPTVWLICWSVGGVLVMSLVPSKRVDRIFPVIPPLCLLLGAQFAQLTRSNTYRRATELCSVLALGVASVLSTGYVTSKIIPAYREHRDAYAVFGRAVRSEAAVRNLRYEVIGGQDEGMLLYLGKTEFAEPLNAVAAWNSGVINAIVGPEAKLTRLAPQLIGAAPSSIGASGRAGSHGTRYVLLVRQ
jgi:4-amino-4-deoxy-L-arabinose transferase-like glycosyltransferase